MSDLYHYIGGDLSLSATGDLQSVDGTEMGQQRVLRRLLSNAGDIAQQITADYIWHTDYGASLPREVGNVNDPNRIKAEILSNMLLESRVSRSPNPVINVTPIASGISVQIQYADAVTNDMVPLAFDINT
jgi:hypothetical protein